MEQLTKDTLSIADRLRALDFGHRMPPSVIEEAADRIVELERNVARWENAHRVAMIERDHFKQIAEINAQTIKGRNETEVYAMGSLFEGSL